MSLAKVYTTISVIMALCLFSGCSLGGSPRVRLGSYATSTPGTMFLDDTTLGSHSYNAWLGENNGIAYTCRGGHIDIAHLRIGADNTRYLYEQTKKYLSRGEDNFDYGLNVDRTVYHVYLVYPENWKSLGEDEKAKIIEEVSLEMAQHFVFTMVTWHEVLTWYGFKTMGVIPEQPSAFSWEDTYSNMVGIVIGSKAVRDTSHNYNQAMTIAIKQELEDLQIQPRKVARDAAEKMRGIWFDGNIAVEMKIRNFNVGDDGYLTPLIVPGICDNASVKRYPVPILAKSGKYGFCLRLVIEPREFEKGQILKIIYPDGKGSLIDAASDLPVILDHVKAICIAQGATVYE